MCVLASCFESDSWRSLDLGDDVRLPQDEEILPVDGDLSAAVLAVEDLVTLADVERDPLLSLFVPLALAGRHDLALLGLLLRGVREDDPAGRGLLLLSCLDDHSIAKGLQLHRLPPSKFIARRSRQAPATGGSVLGYTFGL